MIFLLESPGGKHKTKVSIKNGEPFVLEVLTRIERVTEEPNGDYLEITEDFYQDFVLDKSMVEAWLKEIKKHPDFAGYFKGETKCQPITIGESNVSTKAKKFWQHWIPTKG